MKFPSAFLLTSTFLLMATVNAQGPSMELEAAIQSQPMLSNFYKLMMNDPELNKLKMEINKANTNTNGIQVFAPMNSSPNAPPMLDSLLGSRALPTEFKFGYYLSDPRIKPKVRRTTRSMQRRYYERKNVTIEYPIGVRDTFLDDPEYVNLGPGLKQRLVTRRANSTYEYQTDGIEISTGGGDIVQTSGTPIMFKGGVIFPVDAYFSLPYALSETLCDKGLTAFFEAIKRENLVDKLDDCPGITVFAPLNSGQDCDVKARVVFDFVGYSPDLVPGTSLEAASGTNLTISKDSDGILSVNGEKIVKSDVLVKNGVVHFVDNH